MDYLCDGTNDGTIISQAISNTTTNNTLYFLNGTYNTNNTTFTIMNKNLTFEGESKEYTVFNLGENFFLNSPSVPISINKVIFKNIGFINQLPTSLSSACITLNGHSAILFDNCNITNTNSSAGVFLLCNDLYADTFIDEHQICFKGCYIYTTKALVKYEQQTTSTTAVSLRFSNCTMNSSGGIQFGLISNLSGNDIRLYLDNSYIKHNNIIITYTRGADNYIDSCYLRDIVGNGFTGILKNSRFNMVQYDGSSDSTYIINNIIYSTLTKSIEGDNAIVTMNVGPNITDILVEKD